MTAILGPSLILIAAALLARWSLGQMAPTLRGPLYWGIFAVACSFMTGCSVGVLSSTRVNAGVAVEYVRALEWERTAADKALRAQLQADFDVALAKAKAAHDVTLAQTTADAQRRDAELTRALEQQGEQYSAQVLWLRQQLRAHGISPVVIPATVVAR